VPKLADLAGWLACLRLLTSSTPAWLAAAASHLGQGLSHLCYAQLLPAFTCA
jgi:hypothetical protein